MTRPRLPALRDAWLVTAVALAGSVAAAAAVAGFIWLPSLQTDTGAGLWDRICGAAGIVQAPAAEPVVQPGFRMTEVVMTQRMAGDGGAVPVGRGATLAMQCTTCHGARGLSEANSPNLAGQYAAVIVKQLEDYRSGARTSAIMGPRVAELSGQDMRDLAAYYAYLPRLAGIHPAAAVPVPRIVAGGAPMRNIAPCGSCHGGEGTKLGSAWLEGESPVYLRAQLQAFATGERHNDISQQMRNVARGMSRVEIEEAAQYYGRQP